MTISTIDVQDLSEQPTVVIRRHITMQETARIPEWLRETYEALDRLGNEPSGMPFLRTFAMDERGMDIEVGWPVAAPFSGDGEVHGSSLPGGPVAVTSYFGPYEGIAPAYEAVQAWCAEHGREIGGAPWESYLTDPHEEPDQSKWRTDVHFPLRA